MSIRDYFKMIFSDTITTDRLKLSGTILFIAVFIEIAWLTIGSCYSSNDNLAGQSRLPYDLSIRHQENILHLEQIKFNLIENVHNYITYIAPTTCLNAFTIVDACDDYDIDLIFVLAQGQIESHYGTRGVASKTNSVFNVYSYDGMTADQLLAAGKGYRHPDFSIRPYLDLLQRRYLVDGKTERDLFDNFVDSNGHRYASAENYEQMLMNTYMKIKNETKIDSLLAEYHKYKIITYIK